jgi:hypothetical protein
MTLQRVDALPKCRSTRPEVPTCVPACVPARVLACVPVCVPVCVPT